MSELAERLSAIRQAMQSFKATLVAVSKTKNIPLIQEAYSLGVHDFGENYLQEAIPKIEHFKVAQAKMIWHYLGRIQSNKLKDVATYFDVVHSLDSLSHAHKLNNICKNLNKRITVFVQVNLDAEPQKGGVIASELIPFLERLQNLEHLEVLGLMLLPKPGSDSETLKKFQTLQQFCQACGSLTQGQLSMGMSSDYQLALKAGSTHIRVGSNIFGARLI